MPLDDERKIVVSFGSRCISSVVDDSRVATTERFASETGASTGIPKTMLCAPHDDSDYQSRHRDATIQPSVGLIAKVR
jgi:hypothetical protein